MGLDFLILGGYGQFVWPAFICTFVICFVLYLKTKNEPLVQNLRPLEEIVKIAFSQRRKTLKNCLKSILSQEQTKIDLSQRAEMLSVENFITLMKDYEKQN